MLSWNNWDSFDGKKVSSDIKPDHPKSSWVKGPKGNYDGVPRAYLKSKPDGLLNGKRKHPWDK